MGDLQGFIIDAEAYYSKTYSLRRMSVQEYVFGKDWQCFGWAVRRVVFDTVPNPRPQAAVFGTLAALPSGIKAASKPVWLTSDELAAAVDERRGAGPLIFCAHNANFDATVLARECPGLKPDLWLDTLAMSRLAWGRSAKKHSLNAVAARLGLAGKLAGGQALADVSGMRWEHLSEQERENLIAYALRDAELGSEVLHGLLPMVSPAELFLIDMTVRMMAEPVLAADHDVLRRIIDLRERRVLEVCQNVGAKPTELRSDYKFSARLQAMGVEVPLKVSDKTGNLIPALSVGDYEFLEMAEHHENLHVRNLCKARIEVNSSILESRAKKLLAATRVEPLGGGALHALRVPLNHAGALQTARYSGGDGLNLQNLPHGVAEFSGQKAGLREAIAAPEGHVMVVADLSGIELRVLLTLAKALEAMQRVFSGEDEYSVMAGRLYGRQINKHDDPDERKVGKVAVLSLGYQSGWRTFRTMLLNMAGIFMSREEAQKVVDVYREAYPEVVALWENLSDWLWATAQGAPQPTPWQLEQSPITVSRTDGGLRMDVDMGGYYGSALRWPHLRTHRFYQVDLDTGERKQRDAVAYMTADGPTSIYGGKATENLCQWLAREVMQHVTYAIYDKTGLRPALQVHDENIYVVPAEDGDRVLADVLSCMKGPVPWWPDLILDAEGGVGRRYSEVK